MDINVNVSLSREDNKRLEMLAHRTGARSKRTLARMIIIDHLRKECGNEAVDRWLGTPPEKKEKESK